LGLALLDRDGTLNVSAPAPGWVTRPEDLELLPGAAEAVAMLNDAGIKAAVVTNQRCVALGLVDDAGMRARSSSPTARPRPTRPRRRCSTRCGGCSPELSSSGRS
jgi:hypothetical protein